MTRHSHRSTLEPLEARTLLATCHVTRLGDFGAGADIGGGHWRGDLRYCIFKANTEPGPDTILFSLTGAIGLITALPRLADDLTITGPGADMLAIDAQQTGRVFYVEAGANVEISRLTLRGGYAAFVNANGGGIYNAGALVLVNSTVSHNVAVGGIPSGGGIYNASGAQATIVSSAIFGNHTKTDCAPQVCIDRASRGGGIYNAANANLSIQETTIHGNAAFMPYTTIGGSGYGGGIYSAGPATITNSTLFGNAASVMGASPDTFGGGIYHAGDKMAIVNSTISNNFVWSHGNGGTAWGGGIYSATGQLRIAHSTIASNDGSNPDYWVTPKAGGGIAIGNGAVHIHDTIVADNFFSGAGAARGPDIYGTLASSDYNLIGNTSGGSGYAPTDILDVDPMLGPLGDNGGPTWTIALLPGSPAIDAGDPNPTDPPEWDQRGPGFPRVVNGRIDIGAYEVQATGAARPSARRGPSDPAVAISVRRGSPDPAVATTAGLHLVAWSGDHATTIVSEAPKGRYMTAQGNALGHDPVSDLALKGRNNLAPDAIVMPPLQGYEDSSPLPRALLWADIYRPLGAEGDLSPFSDGGIA
jgi:hypothetical protein